MSLLTRDELRDRYGDFFNLASMIEIDKNNVPQELWVLIPYAELWGISDDLDRERIVKQAPSFAIQDLAAAIDNHEDDLDEWLAGDESYSDVPSREYVAFSAMRMALDFS